MDETRRPSRFTRERRVVTVDDLEVREEGEAGHVITGHPLVYGVWSEDLGGFKERIAPGAAAKTVREHDIRALFNHDPNYVLGRNVSGTLNLSEQVKGIKMRATPPDTTWANDLVTSMRRGDINQMSFSFRVAGPSILQKPRPGEDPVKHAAALAGAGEVWNDDYTEREIRQLHMYDVSVVTFPAYTQTDASARSYESGFVEGAGIDWSALNACLVRRARLLPLTDTDVDVLRSSVLLLQSHIPEPEPVEATTQEAPEAGRSVIVHLRAQLELEAASA